MSHLLSRYGGGDHMKLTRNRSKDKVICLLAII